MLDGVSYAPVSRHTVHAWIQYLRPLNGLHFDGYRGWESIADYMALLDGRTAQNVATFIPYANVRTMAMGFGERQPNDYQLVDIRHLVRQNMEEGPAGISTGLDYVDQCYASTEELIAACRGMRERQGVYVTHVRNALGTLGGLKEAVEIGRRAHVSVHVSHLKGENEAEAEDLIDFIDLVAINEVDFSFDGYPYRSSSAMLQYLLPLEAWSDGVLAAYGRLANPDLRDRFQRRLDRLDLDTITIAWTGSRHNSRYHGARISEYVAATGRRAADALCDLLLEESMAVLLVFRKEENGLEAEFLAHQCYMMGSDGIYFRTGITHPRQYGSATRLLGHYVRRKHLISLEDAIYKLSGFPAARFKIRKRGVLAKGNFADIVVFDADTIQDRATFEHPQRLSAGVNHVIVNGRPVLSDGKPVSGALPGRYLKFGVE